MRIILGLGSNLGDRLSNLSKAIGSLGFLNDLHLSSIYESDAFTLDDSPTEWNLPFLNMAAVGNSDEDLLTIYKRVKQIEQSLGRDPAAPRWSPRIIDIDILLAEITCTNEILTVPHKEFLNRAFALVPAQEVAGEMIHQPSKKKLSDILIARESLRLTNYKINTNQ